MDRLTLFFLVSDVATAKAKLSKVLKKSYNKVQRSVLSIYLIFVQEIYILFRFHGQ